MPIDIDYWIFITIGRINVIRWCVNYWLNQHSNLLIKCQCMTIIFGHNYFALDVDILSWWVNRSDTNARRFARISNIRFVDRFG